MNTKTIFMQQSETITLKPTTMHQTKTMTSQTALALQIVEAAEAESGIKKYRYLKNERYVVNCLLGEFREKFVFITKDYRKAFEQYKRGTITWNSFKYEAEKFFLKELEDCNHFRIDHFFGLRIKLASKVIRKHTIGKDVVKEVEIDNSLLEELKKDQRVKLYAKALKAEVAGRVNLNAGNDSLESLHNYFLRKYASKTGNVSRLLARRNAIAGFTVSSSEVMKAKVDVVYPLLVKAGFFSEGAEIVNC